jgi:hypothetical protein
MKHTTNCFAALLYCQPAEDEGLKEHYSPATVAEVERWAAAVARPHNKEKLRKQHAEAAVAAIQFICRHEPDPGGVTGHVCRTVRRWRMRQDAACAVCVKLPQQCQGNDFGVNTQTLCDRMWCIQGPA